MFAMRWRRVLLQVLLATVAAQPAPGAGASSPTSKRIDAAGMARLLNSRRPALVKFNPAGCDESCTSTLPLWAQLAEDFGEVDLQVSYVECEADPQVCAARKVAGTSAVVKFWTGKTFRRYAGILELQPLRDYCVKKLRQLAEEVQAAQNERATAQERAQKPPAAQWGRHTTSAEDVEAARKLLAALVVVSVGAWLWIKWLARPSREEPAVMLLVGSRSTPTRRVSVDGFNGDGLYVFRAGLVPPGPEDSPLTPVSHMAVEAATNLSAMAAERAPGGRGYTVHVACESDELGGVATVKFDPASAPAVVELGGTELTDGLTCHVASARASGTWRASESRYVACSFNGSVAVLKPSSPERSWRHPSTWRRRLTGVLEAEYTFRPTNGQGGKEALSSALPLRTAPGGKQEVLLVDAGTSALHVVAVRLAGGGEEEGNGVAGGEQPASGGQAAETLVVPVGSLQLAPAARPCAAALHPHAPLVYALCDGDQSLVVAELVPSEPPKLLQRLVLAKPERKQSGATPRGGKAAKSGERGTGGRGEDGSTSPSPPASSGPLPGVMTVSADGAFCYAVLRGGAEVLTLSLQQDGKAASVAARTRIGDGDFDGATADVALVGRGLLVLACPMDDRVLAFRRDPKTGQLSRRVECECPSPGCLLPLPWPPPP